LAWPHDGNLDNKVIEAAWREAQQHRHPRAAFNLKDADCIGLLNHGVGLGIFGRDRGQIQTDVLRCFQKIEAPAHAAQHAEPQHIDLS
jgi:hypothetical protein